jgi:hypothetical protein
VIKNLKKLLIRSNSAREMEVPMSSEWKTVKQAEALCEEWA